MADFRVPFETEWRIGNLDMKPGQVILQGDLGPWNTIWQGDQLTGFIDWDFAHPGERIEDMAQLAYYFIPLRSEAGWQQAGFDTRPDFAHRLLALVEAYTCIHPEK